MHKCKRCGTIFDVLSSNYNWFQILKAFGNLLGTCPKCGSIDFTDKDSTEVPNNKEVSPFDGDTLNVYKL